MTPPDAGPVDTHVIDARWAAAHAWRCDHANHPMRESLWEWYCHGATWRVRDSIVRRSIQHGLHLAMSTTSWATATP